MRKWIFTHNLLIYGSVFLYSFLALTEAYAMTQTDVKQREEEEQQIISGFRPGGESSQTPPGQILPHHLMLQCD